MPFYTFFNEKTQETKEIFMSMKDKHEYIDEEGYQWIRVWHKPQASISSKVDPFNIKKATEITGTKRGTIGDIQDYAKELSEKRKDKLGHDPILDKHYEDYTKSHGGKIKHPDQIKQNHDKTYVVGDKGLDE